MVSKRETFMAVATIPHTLTVLLEIDGSIFGGFTPVEWVSPRDWKEKAHSSLKSVFFVLKDPQNVPAGTLALKPDELSDQGDEIADSSTRGFLQAPEKCLPDRTGGVVVAAVFARKAIRWVEKLAQSN
jgi:hypothetical protein